VKLLNLNYDIIIPTINGEYKIYGDAA